MEKLIIPDWDAHNWHLNLIPDRARVELSVPNVSLVSDGYHSFDELYSHRITLFVALCRLQSWRDRDDSSPEVWRSKVHSDNSVMEGWFIMGIGKEAGKQISYHLPLSYWNETGFAETLDKAPEWDSHTSADVLKRLKEL